MNLVKNANISIIIDQKFKIDYIVILIIKSYHEAITVEACNLSSEIVCAIFDIRNAEYTILIRKCKFYRVI